MANLMKDAEWIGRSFMIPGSTLKAIDYKIRNGSDVSFRFTDTAPGGSLVCNPLPQPCDFADIRVPGKFNPIKIDPDKIEVETGNISANGKSFGDGLSRVYGEVFETHNQQIYLRFGLPRFNSLTQFFGNFYNPAMSSVARTGRTPGFFYTLGSVAGSVITLPLMPLVLAGKIINFFMNKPRSKYYYVEPAPVPYWSAVNTMFNGIAANKGWVPRVFDPGQNLYDETNGTRLTEEDLQQIVAFMPDVFSEDGTIDVFRLANRAQRLARQQHEAINKILENANSHEEVREKINQYMQNAAASNLSDDSAISLNEYIRMYDEHGYNKTQDGEDSSFKSEESWTTSFINEFVSSYNADIEDGSQFVGFRVNHVGTVSETITNQTKESPLQSSLNSMSSSAREARFSLADGNIGDGLFNVLEGIGGAIKDLAMGFADKISVSGIAAFAGRAFTDIPEMYDTSEFELPTSSFTMELRSPYNNPFSQLMNIYLPLCMIFCGACPIATGRQSWAGPFLCEMWFKGHQQVRTGIIKSITIERGTGNIGWDRDGHAMGIDITFTVADLSKAIFMPIKADAGPLDAINGLFDDDNTYTDYLATLSSLSLSDQIYVGKKLRLRLTRMLTQFDNYFSPNRIALITSGYIPGRVMSAMAEGVAR